MSWNFAKFYIDHQSQNLFQVQRAHGIPNQLALIFVQGPKGEKLLTKGTLVCNYARPQHWTELSSQQLNELDSNHPISYVFRMSANKFIVPNPNPDVDFTNRDGNDICFNLGLLCNAAISLDPYRSKANCSLVASATHNTIRVKLKTKLCSGDEVLVNYGAAFTNSIKKQFYSK